MKASELMIGDWVAATCKENIPPVEVFTMLPRAGRVVGIEADCIYLDFCDFGFMPQDLDPVSLTPEILEKNGWKHEFDKEDYMVKYDLAVEGKNCWMMWAVKEHNLDIQRQDEKLDMYNLKVQRVCMPCDFVHQLQLALRCAGLFELANNFKI